MDYLKNIIKESLKNGGTTLTKELKKANLKNGFMVSLIGYEKQFTLNNIESLKKYILLYSKELKKNDFIGLWLDNDIIYLDISKHYKTKKQAIKEGIKNKQKAIYNIKSNKNIYLTKNIYILYKYIKKYNDIIYQKEYNNITELKKDFNIKNIYHYIYNNIDNIKKLHLLKDNYIIIKDNVLINE